MQSDIELVESLRLSGGRVTPQRIAVIDAIRESENHPTVDEIYDGVVKKQPSLSRKTVYQIVNDLANIGAVTLVDVGTGQVRIDPTVEYSHDHFVCSQCLTVYDVARTRNAKASPNALMHGSIESIDTVYRGVCIHCSLNN